MPVVKLLNCRYKELEDQSTQTTKIYLKIVKIK